METKRNRDEKGDECKLSAGDEEYVMQTTTKNRLDGSVTADMITNTGYFITCLLWNTERSLMEEYGHVKYGKRIFEAVVT